MVIIEKNEIVYSKTKPIQRKNKHINQRKRRSTKENQAELTSNENALIHINAMKCMKLHMKMRGVLDVFESNKESILIYHLASLESYAHLTLPPSQLLLQKHNKNRLDKDGFRWLADLF